LALRTASSPGERPPHGAQRLKLVVFALTPAVVLAGVLATVFVWWRGPEGRALNRLAWERTFTERGRSVPASGPREGYWGDRLGPNVDHPVYAWHEPARAVPDLLQIDEHGVQRYRTAGSPKRHVLIVGGSVAFGAYASSIATTYFHVLGTELERLGTPADLTVVAARAWKARQEGHIVQQYEGRLDADLVVALNGLNDLTSGATAGTVFGEMVATRDGSEWTPQYHEHDYQARVGTYLTIMQRVGSFARRHGRTALVVLQPSLAERGHRTAIEERLLEASLVPHESAAALQRSYEAMREGLAELERAGWLHFLDCSRLFDDERATTFTDLWHFSDVGHRLLGVAMAARIAPILRTTEPRARVGAP
jgi:lysophospholipase L1-like esterase